MSDKSDVLEIDAMPETQDAPGIEDVEADAPDVEEARTEAAAPAPTVTADDVPMVLTLVFKLSTVTVTAKRRDIATVATYPLPGDPEEIIDWDGVVRNMKASIDKLDDLERTGVPDIKFPEPPKPVPKPAASKKPADKKKSEKEKPASVPKPAPAPAPEPPAPVEPTLEEIQAHYFGKMVRLPDGRSGAVIGWDNKAVKTLEILTGKALEVYTCNELTLVTKSK